MEEWRDIEGYEGYYQISNMGNVRSLNYGRTGKTQVLQPHKNIYGYFQVTLFKNGKKNYYKVHRLVAQAFLENPNNLPQVNHINENKADNRICNLEFCTAKYNVNYGTRNLRAGEAHKGILHSEEAKKKMSEAHKGIPIGPMPEKTKRKISETNSIPVAQYTRDGKLITIYYGAQQAKRETGISQGNISECCKGNRKTAGGYIWKYA